MSLCNTTLLAAPLFNGLKMSRQAVKITKSPLEPHSKQARLGYTHTSSLGCFKLHWAVWIGWVSWYKFHQSFELCVLPSRFFSKPQFKVKKLIMTVVKGESLDPYCIDSPAAVRVQSCLAWTSWSRRTSFSGSGWSLFQIGRPLTPFPINGLPPFQSSLTCHRKTLGCTWQSLFINGGLVL